MSTLEERVCAFVAERLANPGEVVTPATKFCTDLGVDGADARRFLEEFCAEFKVDQTSFSFDEYFGPEAFDPVTEVIRRLRRAHARADLTVGKLIAAAQRGTI